MGFFPQADTAKTEESDESRVSTTDRASVVTPSFELRFALLFFNQTLFGHLFSRRYRAGLRRRGRFGLRASHSSWQSCFSGTWPEWGIVPE